MRRRPNLATPSSSGRASSEKPAGSSGINPGSTPGDITHEFLASLQDDSDALARFIAEEIVRGSRKRKTKEGEAGVISSEATKTFGREDISINVNGQPFVIYKLSTEFIVNRLRNSPVESIISVCGRAFASEVVVENPESDAVLQSELNAACQAIVDNVRGRDCRLGASKIPQSVLSFCMAIDHHLVGLLLKESPPHLAYQDIRRARKNMFVSLLAFRGISALFLENFKQRNSLQGVLLKKIREMLINYSEEFFKNLIHASAKKFGPELKSLLDARKDEAKQKKLRESAPDRIHPERNQTLENAGSPGIAGRPSKRQHILQKNIDSFKQQIHFELFDADFRQSMDDQFERWVTTVSFTSKEELMRHFADAISGYCNKRVKDGAQVEEKLMQLQGEIEKTMAKIDPQKIDSEDSEKADPGHDANPGPHSHLTSNVYNKL